MIALALLAGSGLWFAHTQAKKRAALLAEGSKAPENANAPTDPLIADDNTGLPTPTRAANEQLAALPPVPLATAEANAGVAIVEQAFTGEPVAAYFAPLQADADAWGIQSDREEEKRREEKNATREDYRQVKREP